jgi:hypothetical protein
MPKGEEVALAVKTVRQRLVGLAQNEDSHRCAWYL